MALADAGIDMYDLVAACTVVKVLFVILTDYPVCLCVSTHALVLLCICTLDFVRLCASVSVPACLVWTPKP